MRPSLCEEKLRPDPVVTALTLSWPALPIAADARKTPEMAESVAPTDPELVTATLRGDEEAFAELVRRHKQRVLRTAARFARDNHQVDDIAQEVFVRAYRHLGKFRGDAPFEHWLARITVSACYDFLRKERRFREQTSLDAQVLEVRDTQIEAALAAGRARELLEFALRKLSADERLIITLAELEEHSMREIATLTGWSESNVKVRAFRARQNLKKILESSHEQ
jgi:RNA polymerase sigma-70 factor (ECF subfamily)